MPKFEGCVEAKEISLCPVNRGGGANPHAHVLMLKSMTGKTVETPTEKTTMPAAAAATLTMADVMKAANKIAAMSDVTKAHYLALPETEQEAFLEKSTEDQAKIATEAKEAADKKKVEEEAAKTGTTVEVLALQKSNADLRAEMDVLKAKVADSDIAKRADTEFAGYPGGSAVLVPLLKAYSSLPEDVRKASEEMLKAQCRTAVVLTRSFGQPVEQDVTKAQGAQARIQEAVKSYAAENKVTESVALEKVSEKPEFAADVELVYG